MTRSLSLKVKGSTSPPQHIFVPTGITFCYHNSRLQARVFTRMRQPWAMRENSGGWPSLPWLQKREGFLAAKCGTHEIDFPFETINGSKRLKGEQATKK